MRQNVRRINKHPSNAQWAGGNEIEGIVINVNQTQANGTHYLNEVRDGTVDSAFDALTLSIPVRHAFPRLPL